MLKLATLTALSLSLVLAGCGAHDEELGTSADEAALTANETVTAGAKLKVTASRLNLREEASTEADVLATLKKGDILTVVATSGGDGWVHVDAPDGTRGWVYGPYVARVPGSGTTTPAPSTSPTPAPTPTGASCDAARASGAVGRYQKALHDVIAYAEGTRGYAKDGYNVMFSHRLFSSCTRHPDQCIAFGSSCSTAAGRYQFLTTTWNTVKRSAGLASFEPENQERGAAYLVETVRRVSLPTSRPLSATEFQNAMGKLSYEWASLPPGRYGQPSKSMSQVRSLYCTLAGC